MINREGRRVNVDMRALAASHDVPYDEVQTYAMSQGANIDLFRRIAPDLLLVVGWQRLVPAEVLGLLSIGALGFHGSCNILP